MYIGLYARTSSTVFIHCSFIHAVLFLIHSHIQGSHLSNDAEPSSHLIALASSICSDVGDQVTCGAACALSPFYQRAPAVHHRSHTGTCTRSGLVTPGWRHAHWHMSVMLHSRCGLKARKKKKRESKRSGRISIAR